MIEDVEINDNEFLRQFELQVGDNMARIEYSLQERKIFLTKYFMPEDMEEQGFRDIFIKAAFSGSRRSQYPLGTYQPRNCRFYA